MLFKKRDNFFFQVTFVSDTKCQPVSMVFPYNATSKKRLQRKKHLNVSLMLHDREFRQHLITQSHVGMLTDSNVETAFSVDKTHDPLGF